MLQSIAFVAARAPVEPYGRLAPVAGSPGDGALAPSGPAAPAAPAVDADGATPRAESRPGRLPAGVADPLTRAPLPGEGIGPSPLLESYDTQLIRFDVATRTPAMAGVPGSGAPAAGAEPPGRIGPDGDLAANAASDAPPDPVPRRGAGTRRALADAAGWLGAAAVALGRGGTRLLGVLFGGAMRESARFAGGLNRAAESFLGGESAKALGGLGDALAGLVTAPLRIGAELGAIGQRTANPLPGAAPRAGEEDTAAFRNG